MNVQVTYYNEQLKPQYKKTYKLDEYTAMLRMDLLRLITDVEDMAYTLNDNKPKSDWSNESWAAFCRIKHKLLDKAGEIERLPQNIVDGEGGD